MDLLKKITTQWRGEEVSPPAPRRPVPDPGDVVRMALPTSDNPNKPGAMLRYGIVVDAKTMPNGELSLRVVPAGDVRAGDAAKQQPHQFAVMDPKSAAAAGLKGPAAFDMKDVVIVGWNQKWTAHNQSPLVGSLPDIEYDKFLRAHTAWRRDMQVEINRKQVVVENASALKQVDYTKDVQKVVRNRGQVEEVWL